MFGRVNLPKIVDAGVLVDDRRAGEGEPLFFSLELLQMILLQVERGAGGGEPVGQLIIFRLKLLGASQCGGELGGSGAL